MRRSAVAVVLIAALYGVASRELHRALNVQEFINQINSLGTTWKAGVNDHFRNVPMHVIRRMMGVTNIGQPSRLPIAEHLVADELEDLDLPESFDPREKWTNCSSLFEVRDQAACGSCWAFGAVEAMTDRVCIESQGKFTTHISAEDLVTCCTGCGNGPRKPLFVYAVYNESCDGGWPDMAWQYWVDTGLVSGSNYTAHSGCQPYEIPPCDHHVVGHLNPCGDTVPTPACQRSCISGYPIAYEQDKHFGLNAYNVPSNQDAIKQELIMHGPVEATFVVYDDLLHYKSGVYQHVSGSELGGHAVKMLGWGVENGTPYWLIANSWNTDWGDKGFFKILRGSDECGIESQISAGIPKTSGHRRRQWTPKHNHRDGRQREDSQVTI